MGRAQRHLGPGQYRGSGAPRLARRGGCNAASPVVAAASVAAVLPDAASAAVRSVVASVAVLWLLAGCASTSSTGPDATPDAPEASASGGDQADVGSTESPTEADPAPDPTASAPPAGPRISGVDADSTSIALPSGAVIQRALDSPALAVVIDEGGRCDGGPCLRFTELASDGRWAHTGGAGPPIEGSFDPAEMVAAAGAATQDAIASGPFTGECPTAVGGMERTYLVFSPDDGSLVVDVSTCRDRVDADAPLIVALDLFVLEAAG